MVVSFTSDWKCMRGLANGQKKMAADSSNSDVLVFNIPTASRTYLSFLFEVCKYVYVDVQYDT